MWECLLDWWAMVQFRRLAVVRGAGQGGTSHNKCRSLQLAPASAVVNISTNLVPFSVLCYLGFSEQQRGWDEETRSVMRWPDWPPRSVQPGTYCCTSFLGENVPQPKYNLTPKSQILTPEVLLVVAPHDNIMLRQFWQEFNTKTILRMKALSRLLQRSADQWVLFFIW